MTFLPTPVTFYCLLFILFIRLVVFIVLLVVALQFIIKISRNFLCCLLVCNFIFWFLYVVTYLYHTFIYWWYCLFLFYFLESGFQVVLWHCFFYTYSYFLITNCPIIMRIAFINTLIALSHSQQNRPILLLVWILNFSEPIEIEIIKLSFYILTGGKLSKLICNWVSG